MESMVTEIKRSRGVTVFGWLFMILGILGCIGNVFFYFNTPKELLDKYLASFKNSSMIIFQATTIFSFLSAVVSFFIGFNILKLKELWRKIALYQAYAVIAEWLILALILAKDMVQVLIGGLPIFVFIQLFFFTREKVKEQFKQL